MLGILVATVVAVPIGALIGSLALAHRLTRFLLEFLRPIPHAVSIGVAGHGEPGVLVVGYG